MVDIPSATIWAPQGKKGPDGDPGPIGPPGIQGPPGVGGPGLETYNAFIAALADQNDPAKGTSIIGRSMQLVGNINALRNLLKTSASIWATTAGYYNIFDNGGGTYRLDTADTTTADNGSTVIVANDGGRWKLWHQGTVSIKTAGLIADWDGSAGTDNTSKFAGLVADPKVAVIEGAPGKYYFGVTPGNTTKFTFTRPITINWNGAEIFMQEPTPASSAWNTTSFVTFLNVGNCRMFGYEFTDLGFNYLNASRGIQPVTILSTVAGTYTNFTFGDFRIRKGQSLLTVGSNLPLTARAKNITFTGACRGDDMYYGINLASNGDNFVGSYTVDTFYRCIFLNDVDNVTANVTANAGWPASANVLINNKGVLKTSNINVKVTIESINGRVDIEGLTVDPQPLNFENINLDVYVKGLGSNVTGTNPIITIGMQDASGVWQNSGTYILNNINIKFRSAVRFTETLRFMTTSPNIGRVVADMDRIFPQESNNQNIQIGRGNDRYVVGSVGDLTVKPLNLSISKIYNGVGSQNFFATVQIISYIGGASNGTVSEYKVKASVSNVGAITIVSAIQVSTQQAGAYNPTFSITSVTPFNTITIGATAGGNASASTVATITISEA